MSTGILICRSNDINPDPRVEKIATSLINNGYHVQIIGWQRITELNPDQTQTGLPIQRINIPAQFGTGLDNIFKLLKWQLKLFIFLVKTRKNYGVIHACDFDTVIPAFVSKLLFKKKLIYDIFDFYADYIQINSNVIKKVIRMIDRFIINRADATIIVDESRATQIKGTHPKILEVIYNTPFDIEPVSPRAEDTSHNGLNITYVGVLQADRGIKELLTVLKHHPNWHLDLAGFGSYLEQLEPQIKELKNVRWHGKVDYSKALQLNAAADALVAIYDPQITNNKFSSPNKLFEAMMLCKPIIVSDHTSMADKVKQYQIGLCIEYGDTQQLEDSLKKLEDPITRREMGNAARQLYQKSFSWTQMEKRLINLYSKIII